MPGWAGRQFAQTISVTSSGLAVSFGIQAGSFRIVNDGAGSLFIDFTSHTVVVATSSGASFQLKSGENIGVSATIERNVWVGFNCTVSSGGTAVARVLALAG